MNEVQGIANPCFLTSFDTIKPRGTYQAALGEFSLEVESSVSEKLIVIVWPESLLLRLRSTSKGVFAKGLLVDSNQRT